MAKKAKTIKRKASGKKAPKKKVSFIPAGYHTLTPYLSVHDGKAAVDFYTKALGAREKPGRMSDPSGKIMHTEIKIGDSHFMMADENPEWGNFSPKGAGKTTVQFMIYCKNTDAAMERAVAAGATLVKPAEDQFYGDRVGRVLDPFGYTWFLATHKEDLSPKELVKRANALFAAK